LTSLLLPSLSRVARQDAVYYRITVDQVKSKNGFIVFCRSLTGKFKLVLFDSNGEVIHIDESLRSRDGSQWESSLYFLSAFSMYRLPPPLHASIRQEDMPTVFNSLDSFTQVNMSLGAGQYLVCVYGDNFIGKTTYSLLAVPTLNDCQEVGVRGPRERERDKKERERERQRQRQRQRDREIPRVGPRELERDRGSM
jgi:hypothetical protein